MKKTAFIGLVYILIASICLAENYVSPENATNSTIPNDLNTQFEKNINLSEHIQLIPLAQNTDTFIIGEGVQSVTANRTVAPYYMNAYETTYDLWYQVRILAETELGYTFENLGQEGSSGRRGRAPSGTGEFQPVTTISWRDAIIWCNALSELQGRTPCYTYENEILRDATNAAVIDLAICNWNADGYRLPTETEWEYGARKIAGKTGAKSFISGATPSGPSWNFESINKATEESVLQSTEDNTPIFHPGTANVATANSLLGPTSTPKSGQPNNSGLYDMSGNVLEFCWDWFAPYEIEQNDHRSTGKTHGTERVSRGGSWSIYASFLLSADRYAYNPGENYNYMGFRIATNKQ